MKSYILMPLFLLCAAYQCEAGIKFLENGLRVAGGDEVDIKDFPYQLYVKIHHSDHNSVCGGSIISKHWALTAGHCIKQARAENVKVYAGSTYTNKDEEKHEVSEAITHPKFDADTTDYDIAVLKMKVPFDFSNKKTQPIALVDAGDMVPDGTKVVVSGWGHMGIHEKYKPVHLRAVQIKIMDRDICDKQFSHFTKNMICVGTKDGKKNSCSGDSGGPLVTLDGVQVGIVSKGHGCELPLGPKVYTNVAQLRSWVKKVTGV